MALIDLYNSSTKLHVVEARSIPGEAVDFFDTQHQFTDKGFIPESRVGDPSAFNDAAFNYFDTLEKNFVPPTDFVPLDGAPGLDAWTPANPYGAAGTPKT